MIHIIAVFLVVVISMLGSYISLLLEESPFDKKFDDALKLYIEDFDNDSDEK